MTQKKPLIIRVTLARHCSSRSSAELPRRSSIRSRAARDAGREILFSCSLLLSPHLAARVPFTNRPSEYPAKEAKSQRPEPGAGGGVNGSFRGRFADAISRSEPREGSRGRAKRLQQWKSPRRQREY